MPNARESGKSGSGEIRAVDGGYGVWDLNRRQAASIDVLHDEIERLTAGMKAILPNTFDRAVRDCINAILENRGHPWLKT